jgi:hypothetical protein
MFTRVLLPHHWYDCSNYLPFRFILPVSRNCS